MRTTERLIQLLDSINATAINNDGGDPGEFIAALCREAAQRLRDLTAPPRTPHEDELRVASAIGERAKADYNKLVSPPDEGLRDPVRAFDSTLSVFEVLQEAFFPRRDDDGMPVVEGHGDHGGDHGC